MVKLGMRLDKPNNLALLLSLLSVGTIFLSGTLVYYLSPLAISWAALLTTALAVAILTFFITRFVIERFLYQKVKTIYQNIHDLRLGSEKPEKQQASPEADLDTVTRDVSQWALQRRTEIEKLRERENFRREFIGNISHELKTPIFNIQGYLLTLLDGAIDDPDINRKYLKRANKSVDRMINIIEDLEAIADLEANRVQLDYSSFDLAAMVRDVFELVEEHRKKRNIQLSLHNALPGSPKVYADQAKIEQVLTNLITNALKYGRKEGHVKVSFSDMEDHLLVSVIDDGLGIPEKDLSRVFERFYRVDKSRSREAGGTGLGLSIVKHIVDVHGQTINVQSQEDQGSTFSFTLQKAK